MDSHKLLNVEIFRAGTHSDDAGRTHTFTPEMLHQSAISYDPALAEAPLVIGHPELNAPAWGWVRDLRVTADDRLVIDADGVDASFADLLKQQRFKKRSASFFPPEHPNNPRPGSWYLRHVGFLGAQAPAVAGLRDIAFDAGEGCPAFAAPLSFSPPNNGDPVMSTTTTQQPFDAAVERLAKLEAEAEELRALCREQETRLVEFSAREASARAATWACNAQALVEKGVLQAADKPQLTAVFEMLHGAETTASFAAADGNQINAVAWLQNLLANTPPKVELGEHPAFGAGAAPALPPVGELDDAALHESTLQYAASEGVSYADALVAVVARAQKA